MTPQLAQAALVFLQRTDLKGGEVNTFTAICHTLADIAQGSLVVVAPEKVTPAAAPADPTQEMLQSR